MVGKGKEAAPESAGSLLAKAKTAFSESLAADHGDGEALITSFVALESAMGAATKEGLLSSGEQFEDMHRCSVLAEQACDRAGDSNAMPFFLAKTGTYEMFRETLRQPEEIAPPQPTDTDARAMSGAKQPA